MAKKIHALLPLVAALSLAACGGGGGGGNKGSTTPTPATPTTTTSGRAVDGYLNGSTVFCDADKNGRQDASEASSTTDSNGFFSLQGACSGTIVVTGGIDTTTNYPFRGTLKSVPGAAYVTPLTTLLADTGLTIEALNTALGLPAGTAIDKLNPMENLALKQRTLAVQQLVQQITNTLGLQGNSGDESAMYSHVASGLAKAIQNASGTPLFSSNGAINASLVTSAVGTAIATVNSSGTLPKVALSSASITALTQAVAVQAQKFLLATSLADIDTVAVQEQDPVRPPAAATNYLYPLNDAFLLNDQSVSLNTFKSGITATTGLTSIGLAYGAKHDPNTPFELERDLDVGMSLEGDGRVLQVKVEQVRVKRHADGRVTLTGIPATQVHIYAKNGQGSFNVSLNDLSLNPLTVEGHSVKVNYVDLVNKVVNSKYNSSGYIVQDFLNIKGSFDVKFAVSKHLNVRYENGASLPTVNVGITGLEKGVEGPGIAGKLTIN